MSNTKRVPLTPIDSSTLKADEPKKKVVRINLTLSEPNKEWCPVFNYETLIKTAQEKKESEADMGLMNKNLNGSAISFSEEDERGLKRIAKQFEEKYGGNGKRKRCQTYTELGAGYDENDSFIDNTEACEEGLMDEIEKKHDGYYINCERFDKDVVSDQSDFEEMRPKHKKIKKIAELTDDDSKETGVEDHAKKPKLLEVRDTSTEDTEQKRLRKQLDFEIKKKPKTVKLLLEEKRIVETNQRVEPIPPPPALPEPKKVANNEDHKSVTEIIESVISAVNEKDGSSNASALTPKSDASSSDSNPEANSVLAIHQPETPPSLPEGLSVELKGIISELKGAARKSTETQRKFFSSNVNVLMLKLESSCRAELTPTGRHTVYSHLAFFLPCSKSTLLARGKKLFMDEGDSELKETLIKIQEIIKNTMPRLQEAYAQRCLKSSLKSTEKNSPGYGGTEEEKPKGHNVHLPRKTFTWNDALKKHLKTIIRLKVRQYNITRVKGLALEVYINNFLAEQLLPFWPKGWMKTSSLYKQCSDTLLEEAKIFKIPCSSWPMSKNIKSTPLSVPLPEVLPGSVGDSLKRKLKHFDKIVDPVRPTENLFPFVINEIKNEQMKAPCSNGPITKTMSLDYLSGNLNDPVKKKKKPSEKIQETAYSPDCHFPYPVNEVKSEQVDRLGMFDMSSENQSESSRLIRFNPSNKVPSKKKKFPGDKVKSELVQSESVKHLGKNGQNGKMSSTSNVPSVIQSPKTDVAVPFTQKAPVSLKHRILKDSVKENEQGKGQTTNKSNLECSVGWSNGTEKPDSRLSLFGEDKKSLIASGSEKVDFCEIPDIHFDTDTSTLPDEAERKLHEETTAATDILSQLITDQNSHSQNASECAAEDKVQMQLNEVIQDLVVLNQMSASNVHNVDDNIDACMNLNSNRKEEVHNIKMTPDFQEEFYSHIRKEVEKQFHSELGDPSSFFNDIPSRDFPPTPESVIPAMNTGSMPIQAHPASKGVIRPRFYQRLQQFSEEDSLSATIQFGWPISGPSPQH